MLSRRNLSIYLSELAAKPWFNLSALICLWLFASLWNIGKAFHMDDTGHLEIAQWIAANPLRPMSGVLSWGEDFQPINNTNQPHLYFYLMAAWGSMLGWSEVSIHLLMALFTLWAIYGFYRIASLFSPDSALIPTALFALSPAFVVGQNTMVDVPLVAVWTNFFWSLLNPRPTETTRYLTSAALCSAALLIKYSSLVLLPALALHIIFRRQYKQLAWTLMPVAVLALWSAFNLYDYGGIHILDRPVGSRNFSLSQLATAWIGTLGAITPFAVLAFLAMAYRASSQLAKSTWFLLSAFNIVTMLVILLFYLILPPEDVEINVLLKWFFLVDGVAIMLVILAAALKRAANQALTVAQLTLLYWLSSSAIFIVAFAPFVATRHVLLSVPPVVVLAYAWIIDGSKARQLAWIGITLTLLVTSLLAGADRWYAEVYRKNATLIADSLPKPSTIWFNGNWGWQWYATTSGMHQLSLNPDRPRPQAGDFIVTPQRVCCVLPITLDMDLTPYQKVIISRDSRAAHFASWDFYINSGPQPWGYFYTPIDVILIDRVGYR